ncbi:amidohydrolase family protein [Steroidobacter sp.]|uniref:amidohydrolase family protein n=1 Tax=Steroidobacter sp. TaxID=1978227 RepID=UPI001A4DF9AC|nr:amidohydrolase family protein [Steroidobacter sp.]MBL8268325.1 amidohydrolase family protein [Steroidobacter sp.]
MNVCRLLWVGWFLIHGSLAFSQDVVIRGARVHTLGAQGTLINSDVLVRDGYVVAVGPGLVVPAGVSVIDAKGRPLTPGLFGGLSAIGLGEVSIEAQTMDGALSFGAPGWQQQWRPEFDVTLAYNPRSTLVPVARIEGLTWTVLAPESRDSLIAGEGAAVSLDGSFDAVLAGSRTLFVSVGSQVSERSGGSRAAQYMLLSQAIREARMSGPVQAGALLHLAGREVLSRYLAGGRVLFEVNRAVDIRAVIQFAQRNGMRPVIAGAAEAWMVVDELVAAGVPVLLDPLQNLPEDFDHLGARADNAVLLHEAGVRVAFSGSNSSKSEDHNARKIRQLAGNAVARGLPWDAALAAITATPAEIFGLNSARGRIAPGQVADLVLWSGDPLALTEMADQVWIAGRAVQMRSRQTELRDRYLQRLQRSSVR